MAASLSVWIALVGLKVLLLSEWAVSKRVTESGSLETEASGSSDTKDDVDSFDAKGWKACQPHCMTVTNSQDEKCTWKKCQACSFCPESSSSSSASRSHHRSRGGSRKGGKLEPDNAGPFASEKGMFAMGGDNKNDCPTRYEGVETQEECEDAAEKIPEIMGTTSILGFHMSEDNEGSPHGCYRQGSAYYFNSNDGAPKSGTSKVCKLMKTYCPPDVESYCAKSVCGDEKWDKEHCPTTCGTCETQY